MRGDFTIENGLYTENFTGSIFILVAICVANKIEIYLVSTFAPKTILDDIEFIIKAINCIAVIVLLINSVRKWKWKVTDSGFSKNVFLDHASCCFMYINFFLV